MQLSAIIKSKEVSIIEKALSSIALTFIKTKGNNVNSNSIDSDYSLELLKIILKSYEIKRNKKYIKLLVL